MKVRLAVLSVSVAIAAIAVACGDSEDEAAPTAEETAYLESVSQAFDLFAANLEEFRTLFGQAWPLQSLLFMALEEAGAGASLDSTLVELEKIDPPKRFAADQEHPIWIVELQWSPLSRNNLPGPRHITIFDDGHGRLTHECRQAPDRDHSCSLTPMRLGLQLSDDVPEHPKVVQP